MIWIIYYPICLAVFAIYDNLCVCTSNQILFLSYWCIELFFLLNPLFRWYKSINYSDVECYHSNSKISWPSMQMNHRCFCLIFAKWSRWELYDVGHLQKAFNSKAALNQTLLSLKYFAMCNLQFSFKWMIVYFYEFKIDND